MPDQPITPDEAVTEAPDVETTEVAATPDQPEASSDSPSTDAPETSDAESGTSEEGEEASEESFTDVDLDGLPEEVQNRYQQMQADYTRKTQALAEQRAEMETQTAFVADLVAGEPTEDQVELQEAVFQALAERLGYDIEGLEADEDAEGDDAETGDEAPEFRDPRVDELLAEREAAKQAEAEQQREQQLDTIEQEIEDGLKALAKEDGIAELSDDELDLLFDKVLSLPPVEVDGQPKPDLKGAFAALKKVLGVNQQRWIDSKRNAAQAPSGEQAEKPVDLMDQQQRVAHMARSIQAATAQQNT